MVGYLKCYESLGTAWIVRDSIVFLLLIQKLQLRSFGNFAGMPGFYQKSGVHQNYFREVVVTIGRFNAIPFLFPNRINLMVWKIIFKSFGQIFIKQQSHKGLLHFFDVRSLLAISGTSIACSFVTAGKSSKKASNEIPASR
jgi:hypothetical protein